jgi:DAACS family dicarboxylate/amino acid:cation (Na+ or H+) symporter
MLLGLVVGAGLGLIARALAGDAPWLQWTLTNVTGPIGQIFLRLLFMLVVPMIFSALVMGVADLELRHLGRLGVRALGYTVVISTIAVLIGLVLVNVFRPAPAWFPRRPPLRATPLPRRCWSPSSRTTR